ncbi:MAG: sulfate adenylyltransferase subunit CysN [Solirubrobacteraceae bacterium]
MELLRFATGGSVDDGKSTLIGRLLYDTKQIFEDQLEAVERTSLSRGDEYVNLALLTDGLRAEREQGITIDVAYRYFSTARRKFIVADAPGHEQYTRNMVTGASTADCAVILLDARKGIVTQTRRHSQLAALLGIRHAVLAVNKMDLVGYAAERFHEIERQYIEFARQIGLDDVTCIPVCALQGDNVVRASERTQWFAGPTLIECLENVEVDQQRLRSAPFRMPVQWVNRADPEFRGFAGTVSGGSIRTGEGVVVAPSGRVSHVARIVTYDGALEVAVAGQAVTLTLSDEIDTSRGDVIAGVHAAPEVADQFEVTIVWMDDEPMLRGRAYLMQIATKLVTATIAPLKYKLNIDSLEHVAAERLELNEIGVCELECSQPIAFDPYEHNRETGGFILIDRITNNTVGAGMIRFALRRSHNISFQPLTVDKPARSASLRQTPCVLWMTGLSGAGKSTIANLVETELHRRGNHTYVLDGDNVRHGLNRDLGFTDADRVENIRRIAEVAKLMVDAGLIVIVSFISPFRSERLMARGLFADGEFIEVFVDTPLSGQLANFTGIDSPYEPPEAPELRIATTTLRPADAAASVIRMLEQRAVLAST